MSTTLSIADISNRVGYTSVGTFSTRFKNAVGVPPTVYRSTGGAAPRIPAARRPRIGAPGQPRRSATVHGRIFVQGVASQAMVFVGLFPGVIPQGAPVRCDALHGPGRYVLEDVPYGTWHVLAYADTAYRWAGTSERAERVLAPSRLTVEDGDRGPLVATSGALTVGPGRTSVSVDMRLRTTKALDPPMLVALAPLAATVAGDTVTADSAARPAAARPAAVISVAAG